MRNWIVLDEPERAAQARTWLYLSIGQQLSQFSVPFIPHPLFKGLMWLFPLLYFAIWYFSFARQQGRYIKQNALDDYTRKSWAKVLTISTIGFVLYLCLAAAILGALSYITKSSTEPAKAGTDEASLGSFAEFAPQHDTAAAPQDNAGADANAAVAATAQPAQPAPVADQGVRPAAALQDYANPELHFAFRYPASWVPTAPQTPNTRVHFISPSGSVTAGCAVIVIRRPDLDNVDQPSIDAVYRELPSATELQGALAQNLQAPEVIEAKIGALAPLPAYDVRVTFSLGSGVSTGFFSGRLVNAASPGYTWTMSCGGSGPTPAAAEQAYKVWEDEIEQVIRSFRFL
jgi:hypothetical protein